MHLIKVRRAKTLFVRLHKFDQTEHLWVLTFRDPVNRMMQSVVIGKDKSWEAVAALWEKIHEVFRDALDNGH